MFDNFLVPDLLPAAPELFLAFMSLVILLVLLSVKDSRRTLTFALAAFAAVDRDDDDPRRPAGHRGNEAFWATRGYVRQPGMTMQLGWNERERGEIAHPLTFWTRSL